MIEIEGLWWPDKVGNSWQHALRHVKSIEFAIGCCAKRRTAVQAGGNVGLWPRRLAECFSRVITFEPDAESLECLTRNVPERVEVRKAALGAEVGVCGIGRKGLGSHRVVAGDSVQVTTIDSLELTDLDFLQLDIEGFEWHALRGGMDTLAVCHPIVQVEIRNFTEKYGRSTQEVRDLLRRLGYREISQQPGSDFVFQWGQA